MNDRDTRRYEMFNRVHTFGQEHAADFAPNGKAAAQFTSLAAAIQALDEARAAQRGDGSTVSKAVLLDALRLDLSNINRTARAIAQDDPGFAADYRPPEHNTQSEILAAVDAILGKLQPAADDSAAATAAKAALVATFVAYELPADFVTHLAADRAAVVAAQDSQDVNRSILVASTASVSVTIEGALKVVAYLDAIMHNKYAREPDTLRAWTSAAHVERAPQRQQPAAAPQPAAVPQAAAARA